jgi:hypothetical protein
MELKRFKIIIHDKVAGSMTKGIHFSESRTVPCQTKFNTEPKQIRRERSFGECGVKDSIYGIDDGLYKI